MYIPCTHTNIYLYIYIYIYSYFYIYQVQNVCVCVYVCKRMCTFMGHSIPVTMVTRWSVLPWVLIWCQWRERARDGEIEAAWRIVCHLSRPSSVGSIVFLHRSLRNLVFLPLWERLSLICSLNAASVLGSYRNPVLNKGRTTGECTLLNHFPHPSPHSLQLCRITTNEWLL